MTDPYPELPAPNLPELELRFTADFDGIELRRILSNPRVWPWFPFAEGREMDEAVSLWMSFSRYRLGLTAVWADQVVGMGVLFPLPYKKMAHQTSFYLAVDPDWQRRGIGTTLLRNLMHLAKERFRLEFIHADVYQGCPILPLMERAGFVTCLAQSDYIEQRLPNDHRIGFTQEDLETAGLEEHHQRPQSGERHRVARLLMQRRLTPLTESEVSRESIV